MIEQLSWAAAFAPAKQEPIAKMMPHKKPDCALCGCPEKGHCRGDVAHSKSKGYGTVVCTTRHCEACTLCFCTGYQEPK